MLTIFYFFISGIVLRPIGPGLRRPPGTDHRTHPDPQAGAGNQPRWIVQMEVSHHPKIQPHLTFMFLRGKSA